MTPGKLYSAARRLIDVDNDTRDREIVRNQLLERMMEYPLRLVELILICGAIVFVENKARSGHLMSTIVAALVAIYARARATSGMLELMVKHELSARRQRFVYWLISGLALGLWFFIYWLTNAVVPIIANAQTS